MFEFDSESHIYKLEGTPIPSVTQVLAEAGLVDSRWFSEFSRWRGSAVHLACWFDDQNDLDESTVEPGLMGYVDAYRLFRDEYKFRPSTIEEPRYHPTFRFAGTVDRTGTIQDSAKLTILDLKSGVPLPVYRVQLAAYALLVDPLKPFECERMALYLGKDGKYKAVPHPTAQFHQDQSIFLSALSVVNWKRKELR